MKFNLLFLALATAVATAPAPENPAVDTNAVEATTEASDGDVSIQATKKWQATGGCKTDWAGRCNAQCIGEGKQKGYKCENVDSDITSSGCFVGWNTCECTCFY